MKKEKLPKPEKKASKSRGNLKIQREEPSSVQEPGSARAHQHKGGEAEERALEKPQHMKLGHHDESEADFDAKEDESVSSEVEEAKLVDSKSTSLLYNAVEFLRKMGWKLSDRITKPDTSNFSFRQIKEINLSKNLIISNLNPTLIKWDLFVIILAVYSCITIPLNLSFKPTFLSEGESVISMSTFVDICFGIDILIMFRTTSINLNTGVEITNGREIAIAYLKSRFLIDFVSAVPIDKFIMLFYPSTQSIEENVKHFVALSCLKMIRILRINRLLIYLNSSSDFKLQIKLYKMFFFLLLYIHFTACLWYFIIVIIRYEEESVAQKERVGCDLNFNPDSW